MTQQLVAPIHIDVAPVAPDLGPSLPDRGKCVSDYTADEIVMLWEHYGLVPEVGHWHVIDGATCALGIIRVHRLGGPDDNSKSAHVMGDSGEFIHGLTRGFDGLWCGREPGDRIDLGYQLGKEIRERVQPRFPAPPTHKQLFSLLKVSEVVSSSW